MAYSNVHATYTLKYYDGANWVDITADAMTNPIASFWGMVDNKPETLVAAAGQLTFTLNNALSKYVPGIGSPATGWDKGTPVRLTLTYDGESYVSYRGRVDTLTVHNEYQALQTVDVSCLDWNDFAAKYPVESLQVVVDKGADVAMNGIIDSMPIKPAAREIETGNFVFPSLNDAISTTTHAMEEFAKLANSEWGHCYIRHDRAGGETLVFENSTHRSGLNPLSHVAKMKADSGFLLKANSATNYILKANTSDRLIPDLVDDAVITNLASAIDETYADNIVNRVTINAYPKTVDASAVVLYKLGNKPLRLNSGAIKTIKGKYTNPSGGNEISGMGMIQPVATTDYLMNTLEDGTGTDITANLTIVCTYDSSRPTYTLTNTSNYVGFITKLQARGFGIYQDNALTVTLESNASELLYGYQEVSIKQTYQQDVDQGTLIGNRILDNEKKPRVRVNSITFDANYSTFTMQMFLTTDVGSLIRIVDTRYSVSDWFYVQGVNFSISPAGIIKVTYTVQKMRSLSSGALSPIGLTFHDLSTDGMDYGDMSLLLNDLHDFSISFWIRSTAATNNISTILGAYDTNNGFYVYYVYVARTLRFVNRHFESELSRDTVDQIPTNTLTHVLITGNLYNLTDPKIYFNGVLAVLAGAGGSGSYRKAKGSNLMIGNDMLGGAFTSAFVGYLKDIRLYNRILTTTEAVTLYNAGVPNASLLPAGLIFQGPMVRIAELGDYEGHVLTSELKVLDNIYGTVGTAHGSPDGLAF